MAKQTIDIGTVANDHTGDSLRDAFDKVNDNFNELYSADVISNGSYSVANAAYTQANAALHADELGVQRMCCKEDHNLQPQLTHHRAAVVLWMF